MNDNEKIKEINQHIKDALEQWANVLLTADADEWSYLLNFTDKDVMCAVLIFNSVLSNIGIKRGHISMETAAEFGKRLHDLVADMTGVDTYMERKANEMQ